MPVTDTWVHGPTLRKMREAKKLSQEAAARQIGVGQLSYGDWERGKQRPKDENLKAIAEVFGIDARELGYTPPRGWELVPSTWIRQAFEQQQERETRILSELKQLRRDLKGDV